MNGVVTCSFLGGLGNNLFTYCFARAHAERVGAEFQCDPWPGSKIFQLNDRPIANRPVARRDHESLRPDETDVDIRTYAQCQKCLIYTRKQVKEWFKFQAWVDDAMAKRPEIMAPVMAHRRRSDYAGYGYVVVSPASYIKAWFENGFDDQIKAVADSNWPTKVDGLPDYVPDFYRMTKAKALFRGNSTYSWWAGTLGDGEVFSPIVAGLEGGKEHDCEYVRGNWPKFADIDGVTDLHLPE